MQRKEENPAQTMKATPAEQMVTEDSENKQWSLVTMNTIRKTN